MFKLSRRQAVGLKSMSHMNTNIPSTKLVSAGNGNSGDTRPISRIISPNQVVIYRSRSQYGQKLWSAINELPETLNERYKIHKALRLNQKATFSSLLDGCRKQLRINNLMTQLFICGISFNSDQIDGYTVRDRDITGKTALHYAVCGGCDLDRPSLANRLVRPLLRASDENGVSALMLAAERGDIASVQALMYESGMRDKQGRTALMYALTAKKAAAASILWEAESQITDHNGNTADIYVTKYKMEDKLQRVADYQAHLQTKRSKKLKTPGINDKFIEDADEVMKNMISVQFNE